MVFGVATMDSLRPNEVRVDPPPATDAGLVFIGRLRTPWATRKECPHQGAPDGPVCRVELFAPLVAALEGVADFPTLQLLYWLDQARRDLVRQSPRRDGATRGTFSIRSPVRPNPIGVSTVALVGVEGPILLVRGLDCVDGTPLLDIKPERCPAAG